MNKEQSSQQMVVENFFIYIKKNEVETLPYILYKKINSKM